MAVIIGSARSDEKGGITGGKAGDQKNGAEVSTQDWYLHSKGWIIVRCKDAKKRAKIATSMKSACNNNHIGYDQSNRYSLYNEVKSKGFDPAKCDKDVETDCSGLTRVCICYAGYTACGDFNTESLVSVVSKIKDSKGNPAFEIITDKSITSKSDYLLAGDILVTATKGHVVVVITDGPKAGSTPEKAQSASTSTSNSKKVTYYPKYTGSSTKIDDIFKKIGAPYGSASKRKPVAVKNGISNYSGTYDQNTTLMKLAKTGKLIK